MAADWIKMRVDLISHPKIVRILSATKADKFRVIGGLHAVWSVFDTHSEDGNLKGYTPELMDHVIGWDGFSRAMESVGWLVYDGQETLSMPEFTEHNGKSAKRRAEDQKRKRDARNDPQAVQHPADKLRTESGLEKEKEKEEKKATPATLCVADLVADGVDDEAATEFLQARKRKRAPLTRTAWAGIKAEATKAGWPLDATIRKCLARGWIGFEARWVENDKPARSDGIFAGMVTS